MYIDWLNEEINRRKKSRCKKIIFLAWGCSSMVKYLPSICKALGWSLRTAKINKWMNKQYNLKPQIIQYLAYYQDFKAHLLLNLYAELWIPPILKYLVFLFMIHVTVISKYFASKQALGVLQFLLSLEFIGILNYFPLFFLWTSLDPIKGSFEDF